MMGRRYSAGYSVEDAARLGSFPFWSTTFELPNQRLKAGREVGSRLLLHIPKTEMKSGKEDFNAEIPDHVARRLRWYRRHILPRLNADVNGDLFVTRKGVRKDQETITIQITRAIEDHLGVYMTVHQFRHLAGASYLEDNPEDMETPRALLNTLRTCVTFDGR